MIGNRERLLKLPYSMGCVTESCVALGKKNQLKKQKHHAKHVFFPPPQRKKMNEGERQPKAKMRKIRSFLVLPNYGVTTRVNRVIKRFKSFPKLFVSAQEEEEEEEEEEKEIEIGLPTDVKHVTHIGWDGATAISPTKGRENLQASEILSLSSISLRQFELAMNTQSGHHSVCVSSVEMT